MISHSLSLLSASNSSTTCLVGRPTTRATCSAVGVSAYVYETAQQSVNQTVKEIATKSGDRMAFLTLEDTGGAIEVTVFPETYRNAMVHLRSGQPILVRGKLEGNEDGRKLLAEEIRPISVSDDQPAMSTLSQTRGPAECRIRLAPIARMAELLTDLSRICRQHAGSVPLYLHFRLDDGCEVVIQGDGGVRHDPALVEAVEGRLGPGAISFE